MNQDTYRGQDMEGELVNIRTTSLRLHHIGRMIEGLGALKSFLVTADGYLLHRDSGKQVRVPMDSTVGYWNLQKKTLVTEHR